jgi:capsular polysaccharide biosynthesis protein
MDNLQLNGKSRATPMALGLTPDDTPKETYGGDLVLSHTDLIRIVRRRLWVIVLVGVIFAGVAAGFSFLQTPTYEASIKILIGQKQSSDIPPDLGNEVAGLQQLTGTMVEAVQTRPVAEGVIQRLDLSVSQKEFLDNLRAEQIGTTSFINVLYTDTSPKRAQQIANAVGEVFSKQVSDASPSANAITATVWEEAALPDSPVAPTPLRDVLLALALGLVLGAGLAYLLEYLDNSWESPDEVEAVSGVPTYGVIPSFGARKSKRTENS